MNKRRVGKPRASYHHGDLSNAILDATLELLGEVGLDRFSLREAARRVGVDAAAVYRHFANKQAVLAALAERGFVALAEQLERAAATAKASRSGEARLRASGEAYVHFALDQPVLFRLMFRAAAVRGGPPSAANPAFAELLRSVEQLERELGLALPREAAALVAWSAVHGLASLLVDECWVPPSTRRLRSTIAALTRTTVRGLIANPRD